MNRLDQMKTSAPIAAALFITSVVGLWRFQIPISGVGVPIYLPLCAIVAFAPVKKVIFLRFLFFSLFITVLLILIYFSRIDILRPAVSFSSIFALFFCWVAASASIYHCAKDKWRYLSLGLKIILRIQIVLQLMEALGLGLLDNQITEHYFLPINRASGLFSEPSHVAMSLSFLIFSLFFPRSRIFGRNLSNFDYLLVCCIFLLCPSVTAIAISLLSFAFRVFYTWKNFFIFSITLYMFTPLLVFYTDYLIPHEVADRVITVFSIFHTGEFDVSSNLSSVVFYGGFSSMVEALRQSPIVGVGLNNMAYAYMGDALYLYFLITGGQNVHDGSSILFKILSEFGLFGCIFLVFAISSVGRFFGSQREDLSLVALSFPLFACFFRGAGYFDGTILLSFSVIFSGFHSFPRVERNGKERVSDRSQMMKRRRRVRLNGRRPGW